MSSKLLDTKLAFDSVAADYDGPSGNNSLIQGIRKRTMVEITKNNFEGARLIDLGCGTGIDTEYLTQFGFQVTAIDCSLEMVKRTKERIDKAALQGKVAIQQLGIQEIDQLSSNSYSCAYSDLGPLNCVPDLDKVARSLNKILAPKGMVIASVIGKICPWEIVLFVFKGQWTRARFRLSNDFMPAPLNEHVVWTRYYSPDNFVRVFRSAGFRLISLRTVGLLVPPPYMQSFADRNPNFIRLLQKIEDRIAGWPIMRDFGDHFLVVMQKNE